MLHFPIHLIHYRSFGIYKKSSGDFFILNISSASSNSNRSNMRFILQRLTILENSDNLVNLIADNTAHTTLVENILNIQAMLVL